MPLSPAFKTVPKNFSTAGLVLCAVYLWAIVLCIALATASDPKARFVFLQLPIALQLAGLDALGLRPMLIRWDWITAYLVVGVLTLCALYGLGAALGRAWRAVARALH